MTEKVTDDLEAVAAVETTGEPETDDSVQTASEAVLSADGVGRDFGSVTVLEDISIELSPGTLVGLVGPNGSGKTTLVQVLAGLLEPTRGTVSYHGPETERRIGYLPQNPEFRHGFTAQETLEFYTTLARDDVSALLSSVGISDAAGRRVEALSGGMTRLLGLAQSMVGDPPVVLLDEPGSGLDPGMRRQTFRLISELTASGSTVLCSSHDLTLVEEFCDEVAILDAGALVAAGEISSLCADHDEEDLWDVFHAVVDRPTDELEVVGASE